MQKMDKIEAIKISKKYLQKLKNTDLMFSEAWLFGSYARGNQHEDSDIDIAIVLRDEGSHSFETEVKLMTIREGEETRIEPHAFTKNEFDNNIPIVNQIIKYGMRLDV
jgi:predicted nucleotidyltransferase